MNYKVEMGKLLAQLTLEQRLEMHAIEARNLWDICFVRKNGNEVLLAEHEKTLDILEDIDDGEYDRAIVKATGNYEPPDDTEAWSGGFASNH